MAKKTIDIGMGSYENVNEISTTNGTSPVSWDTYKDESKTDNKRHGYEVFKQTGGGDKIDGTYWSKNHQNLYVVSNGTVFRVGAGATLENLGSGLLTGNQVKFAEDETNVYMANGGRIYYLASNDTSITAMADSQAPTTVIGLGYIDGRLLAATELSVHYSPIDSPLSWNGSVFTPESRPDGIKAMHVAFREITLFGDSSVDVYKSSTDASDPITRLDGAFIETGTIAGNSVQRREDTFYFLDDKKKVNTLTGRRLQSISSKIDKEISSYKKVDDAIGMIITMYGKEFYALRFPTEGKTWVYDIQLDYWTPWSFWNTNTGMRQNFRMNTFTYAIDWNKYIIGDSQNGTIYSWSDDVFTDNDNEIRAERVTGLIDHGTNDEKRCNYLTGRVQRGIDTTITANTREGKMMIKHRNENQDWSNEKIISLGYDGDRDIIWKLRRQGTYRARQWAFIHTDPTPFKFPNSLDEDVDILTS